MEEGLQLGYTSGKQKLKTPGSCVLQAACSKGTAQKSHNKLVEQVRMGFTGYNKEPHMCTVKRSLDEGRRGKEGSASLLGGKTPEMAHRESVPLSEGIHGHIRT